MKHINLILILFTTQFFYAQVGIKTANPEKELHVNGTTKADKILINTIQTLGATEKYRFLIKSPSNKITTFNDAVDSNAPTPINRIKFIINFTEKNGDQDFVGRFDTKINYDKYLCVISSYSYNLPVYSAYSTAYTPLPLIYAYQYENPNTNAKTWALSADYLGFLPSPQQVAAKKGQWILDVLIFDRKYTKEINVAYNLNGSSTGAASSAIVTGY